MIMYFRELLLVFTMFWNMSSSLLCYKCVPQAAADAGDNTCEHFDSSKKYEVECKHSSMCHKQEITSSVGNNIKLYIRDCAMQSTTDERQRTHIGWISERKIHDVYEEACKTKSDDAAVSSTVDCYCKGDLCNAAGMLKSRLVLLLVIVGLMLYRF